MGKIFGRKITKDDCRDSGMALTLLLLIIGFIAGGVYFKFAAVVILTDMIYPKLFYPFAVLWFALTETLGTLVSKVILTIVFFILVVPVGLFRKALGKDSLRLKQFKKDANSVFARVNKKYTAHDLEKPY